MDDEESVYMEFQVTLGKTGATVEMLPSIERGRGDDGKGMV
jgi:hypothetical protein